MLQLINYQVRYFNLTMSPCPPGHILYTAEVNDEHLCRCDDNDQNIIECLPEQNMVVLKVKLLFAHLLLAVIY